jgi:hypothetical protein
MSYGTWTDRAAQSVGQNCACGGSTTTSAAADDRFVRTYFARAYAQRHPQRIASGRAPRERGTFLGDTRAAALLAAAACRSAERNARLDPRCITRNRNAARHDGRVLKRPQR